MPYGTPTIVGTPEEQQATVASSITFTPSQAPTIGKTVICIVRGSAVNSTTITATGWTTLAESGGSLTPSWKVFARQVLNSGGSPDFTGIDLAFSSVTGNYDISWSEWTNLDALLDQATGTPITNTGTATGAMTGQTPVQNALTLALVVMNGAISAPADPGAGFTLMAINTGSTDRMLIAYEANASGVASGSPGFSWTTSRTWRAVLFTIRAADTETVTPASVSGVASIDPVAGEIDETTTPALVGATASVPTPTIQASSSSPSFDGDSDFKFNLLGVEDISPLVPF